MIPASIILSISIALGLRFDPSPLPTGEPVPFRVLINSRGYFVPFIDGHPVPPVSTALHSVKEETDFLDQLPRKTQTRTGFPPFVLAFPAVDYSTHTLAVITSGPASSSLSVRVDSVIAEARTTTVFTTTIVPCALSRDFTNHTVIIEIDGPYRDLSFAKREEHPPCR